MILNNDDDDLAESKQAKQNNFLDWRTKTHIISFPLSLPILSQALETGKKNKGRLRTTIATEKLRISS
jgi:hypothetical protein